jgi:F-type H+-transporting ATPase subunit b
MESLLKPDIGLAFWTLVNFSVLALVLYKIAWKPLLKAIQKREQSIKQNIETAETAKTQAQKMHDELERKMKDLTGRETEILQKAQKIGEGEKDKILDIARQKARQIIEQSKKDLSAEKEKLIRDLRGEIADISVMAAEKIISKEINKKAHEKILDDTIKTLTKKAG